MGVPNFKLYYVAVLLDQLKFWWSPNPQKIWPFMETFHLAGPNTQDLLFAIKLGNVPNSSGYLRCLITCMEKNSITPTL